MKQRSSTVLVQFGRTGEDKRVSSHIAPRDLIDDVVARIAREYGAHPTKRHARQGIYLDAGGMVMMDQPSIRVRLPGYCVNFKLEHAPYLASYLRQRLDDESRARTFGGKDCVTIYMRYVIAVIPRTDAEKVLAALKKHSDAGLRVGQARRAELVACGAIHPGNMQVGES